LPKAEPSRSVLVESEYQRRTLLMPTSLPLPPSLDCILDRLPNGDRTPIQLQVAMVVTLLEAAGAGAGGVQPEELMKLSGQLFAQFGLSDGELGHLLEVAALLRKEPEKSKKLLLTIREQFSYDQRVELLSIVWRIFMVDKKIESCEGQKAVEIRQALGLTMEAAVAARKRAEEVELARLVESYQVTPGDGRGESAE
jgi:uncharacterized tellurite resistance protein B-like protein